jgi:hypothetical protein
MITRTILATLTTLFVMFVYAVVVFFSFARTDNQVGLNLIKGFTIWHPMFWTLNLAVFTWTWYLVNWRG